MWFLSEHLNVEKGLALLHLLLPKWPFSSLGAALYIEQLLPFGFYL